MTAEEMAPRTLYFRCLMIAVEMYMYLQYIEQHVHEHEAESASSDFCVAALVARGETSIIVLSIGSY
jgi:hypothetical protein